MLQKVEYEAERENEMRWDKTKNMTVENGEPL